MKNYYQTGLYTKGIFILLFTLWAAYPGMAQSPSSSIYVNKNTAEGTQPEDSWQNASLELTQILKTTQTLNSSNTTKSPWINTNIALNSIHYSNLAVNDANTYINSWTNTSLMLNSILQTAQISMPSNGILYVNKNVIGGNGSGDSWANAIPELADALLWARTEQHINNNWLQNDSLQIYVAKGTYKPLYSARDVNYTANENRDNAFVMLKNVQLYGGFAGTETSLANRDLSITVNASILSGDLNGDDIITGNADTPITNIDENAYHVVISAGDVGSALLDGFSLTRGNANGIYGISVNQELVGQNFGGGIYNLASSPTLTNLNITENNAKAGGGIANTENASPTLTNLTITNNTAHFGGGIVNDSASPTLTNLSITGNTTTYNGGGIHNQNASSPNLTDVTITANTAQSGAGINNNTSSPTLTNVNITGNTAITAGGGIADANNSSSSLTNVTITANTAKFGGGMNNYNSSPSLTRVTITANTANNSGGGMYSDSSTLNLTNVHISGNTASSGAGIYSDSSKLNLTKVEITENIANNNGGGMYSNSSTFNLTNVHISGNTAENGGGIINWNNSSSNLTNTSIIGNIATNIGGGLANDNSSLSLTNVTIAGNTANQVSAMHSQNNSAITINNTLVWGDINYNNSTYTASYSLIEGDNNTSNGNIDATGLNETDIFTDPANADYNLKDGNPAINTGDNSLYTGDINNDTDLAGNPRLYDNIIDMGAYESQTPTIILTPDANNILYVNKNVTGGTQAGDSWANAIPELADALKWARTQQDADSSVFNTQALQIYVAKGTYKPLYSANDGNYTNDANRDNAFVMLKNVQLYGGFDPANNITDLTHTRDFSENTGSILSGDFNNDDVVTGSGASLSFSNNTENAHHILIAAGNLGNALLDGFSLIGGNADGTNPILVNGQDIHRSHGSGMYSKSSSPGLTNITITKNSASHGGGIYNFDSSSPSLTNVVITKNKALNNGGGIRNNKNCSPSLINVNITENLANNGGGIYTENNSSPSLTNVTITINHATTNGSEIYNTSSLTINNSIVWGGIVNTNGGNHTINYSLIQGNSNTSNGNLDTTGLNETDIFTDPANADYNLKDGSPAINTGDNTAYTNAGGDLNNDTDLAGNTRLFGSTIDIGAFEYYRIKTYWTGNINTDWHTAGNW
ncbi:beta strand repeat-containing protein, partial [Mesonia hippocampi]